MFFSSFFVYFWGNSILCVSKTILWRHRRGFPRWPKRHFELCAKCKKCSYSSVGLKWMLEMVSFSPVSSFSHDSVSLDSSIDCVLSISVVNKASDFKFATFRQTHDTKSKTNFFHFFNNQKHIRTWLPTSENWKKKCVISGNWITEAKWPTLACRPHGNTVKQKQSLNILRSVNCETTIVEDVSSTTLQDLSSWLVAQLMCRHVIWGQWTALHVASMTVSSCMSRALRALDKQLSTNMLATCRAAHELTSNHTSSHALCD